MRATELTQRRAAIFTATAAAHFHGLALPLILLILGLTPQALCLRLLRRRSNFSASHFEQMNRGTEFFRVLN